jgi:glycosyltransferase involved in cell wall biosynthesis
MIDQQDKASKLAAHHRPGHRAKVDVSVSFTVAICTRNRARLLMETIQAVDLQLKPFTNSVLLVVDNASTDDTAERITDAQTSIPNLRYVVEKRAGIRNARQKAIECAQGDYILFLDDDALPGPRWVEGLLEEFANDPELGIVGTAIHAQWEDARPDWISERMLRDIPVMSFPQGFVVWRFPCYPPTVSLGVRRHPCLDLFINEARRGRMLFGYTEAEIRNGTMCSGEDLDLSEIYSRNGLKIISINDIYVRHRIFQTKLTRQWLSSKFESDGRMRIRLTRVAGYPVLGRHTLPTLAALPILALAQLMRPILPKKHAYLIHAYFRKAIGAWQELLFGPTDIRYPYKLPNAARSS